jgi:hypothetical protein
MNETSLDALTQRVDRLERENHRLKRTEILVIVAFGALALMGQTMPNGKVAKVIEAERFVLRDARGRERAVLGMVADKIARASTDPSLDFYAVDGVRRVRLGISPFWSDPSLDFYAKDGGDRISLGVSQIQGGSSFLEGGPLGEASYLHLRDKSGLFGVALTAETTGDSSLDVSGSGPGGHVELLGKANGPAELNLYAKNNTDRRATLFVAPNGTSALAMPEALLLASEADGTRRFQVLDRNGAVRFGLLVNADGTPALLLQDEDNRAMVGMAVTPDSPAVALYDVTGRERASLGIDGSGLARFTLNGADVAPAASRHWILWHQGLGRNTAYGAWSTKDQCEASPEFLATTQAAGQTGAGTAVCLPDTVTPVAP